MENTLKQGTLDLVLLSILENNELYGLQILQEVNIRDRKRRRVGKEC